LIFTFAAIFASPAISSPRYATTTIEISKPRVIAEQDKAFAHEGPVFVQKSRTLYFTSNRLGSGTSQAVEISKLQLSSAKVERVDSAKIPMANGACLTPRGTILFCAQGTLDKPAGLYEYDVESQRVQPRLTSWHGKPFNSLNDVVIDANGFVWFTDPCYGYEQGFRPKPQLGSFVWRGKYSESGEISNVQHVIDDFVKPNGILVSNDGKKLFVTDTGFATGTGTNPNGPRAIYSFDVVDGAPKNKKLIAKVDSGIPDGLKLDRYGNLFVGCGDGVRVYDPQNGKLLAKAEVSTGVANFAVVDDELMMLCEKSIQSAKIKYHN